MSYALVVVFVIVVVMVAFGVWLVYDVGRTQREQLQTLAESQCLSCRASYGVEAAERAREAYVARCIEIRRQNPDKLINFVRYWEIRCARCGAEARFYFEKLKVGTDDE